MKKVLVLITASIPLLLGCNFNLGSVDNVTNDSSYTVYKSNLYDFELSYPASYNIAPTGKEELSYGNEQFGISIFGSNRKLFTINIIFTPDFSTLGVDAEAIEPLLKEQNIRAIANVAYEVNEADYQTEIIDGIKKIDLNGYDAFQMVLDNTETFGHYHLQVFWLR